MAVTTRLAVSTPYLLCMTVQVAMSRSACMPCIVTYTAVFPLFPLYCLFVYPVQIVGGTDGDWWMARSIKSGREGYIPRNYVAAVTSFEAEE